MIIGIKDAVKWMGISVIACCAVFVCTLFLNYNMDIVSVENEIATEIGVTVYHAQVSMGKVTAAVTGGCLGATSVIMLLFYIKNYINTHSKELGILKALGYSNLQISKHFWVFGLSVFLGCTVGFTGAFLYLPRFYGLQNAEGYFPDVAVRFHPLLMCLLVVVPTAVFMLLSVGFAYVKLQNPVLDLLRGKREHNMKTGKRVRDGSFLTELPKTTLSSKKVLVFLVAFSAFCFSAMVQMSLSMRELASDTFAWMILLIGLILAFMTLFLSLSNVVQGNAKTLAIMRVFGYEDKVCSRAVLGAYRPISYIGFAVGTLYQYGLLKLTMTFIFSDMDSMPEYRFDFQALVMTLVAFVMIYESVMYVYSLKIRKVSVKSIMLE